MTKKIYSVVIGEGNKELYARVINELRRVGFSIYSNTGDVFFPFIYIYNDLDVTSGSDCGELHRTEVLLPSYVLEHAAELDGAVAPLKPWEIPPEGYRLVTEEERKAHPQPSNSYYISTHFTNGWKKEKCVYWDYETDYNEAYVEKNGHTQFQL